MVAFRWAPSVEWSNVAALSAFGDKLAAGQKDDEIRASLSLSRDDLKFLSLALEEARIVVGLNLARSLGCGT